MAWIGLIAAVGFGVAAVVAPLYIDDAMPASTFSFVIALFSYEFIYQRRR